MSDKERILEIDHLSKSFGAREVLRDIHFSVNKKELWINHNSLLFLLNDCECE